MYAGRIKKGIKKKRERKPSRKWKCFMDEWLMWCIPGWWLASRMLGVLFADRQFPNPIYISRFPFPGQLTRRESTNILVNYHSQPWWPANKSNNKRTVRSSPYRLLHIEHFAFLISISCLTTSFPSSQFYLASNVCDNQ